MQQFRLYDPHDEHDHSSSIRKEEGKNTRFIRTFVATFGCGAILYQNNDCSWEVYARQW
jgi:hypothetical protein